MELRTALFALAVFGSASLVAASCAIPGFDQVTGSAGGTATGGSGATGGGGAGSGGQGGSGACGSLQPPLPPAESDPGTDDVDFVVALRTLDFGESLDAAEGPTVGYDLDKECTCLGGNPTCQAPGSMPVDCDGPGGRDNAVARLFQNLGLFEPETFTSEYQSGKADAGDFSILFRVSDYNGQPNDTAVTLAVYTSPGIDKDPCFPAAVANWDGNDAWPIDAVTLNGMGSGGGGGMGGSMGCGGADPGFDVDDPKYVSQQAYVVDNVLVADLPNSSLVFTNNDSATVINLVAGFLTGTIEQDANGRAIRNGVLTGRWRVADIFAILPTIENNNEPICKDSDLFGPVKSILCNYPDITGSVAGAAAPCDALSFGMGFDAEAATLGAPVPGGGESTNTCPPGQDPSDETCDGM
jgi:hypothetical protein